MRHATELPSYLKRKSMMRYSCMTLEPDKVTVTLDLTLFEALESYVIDRSTKATMSQDSESLEEIVLS